MVFVFLVISLRLMAMSDSVMENYYPERTKGVLEQAQEKGSNQVLCGRIKIKPEGLKDVYEWFKVLRERKD